MQEIEPPEVPLGLPSLEPKDKPKQGILKKLFSKVPEPRITEMPDSELPKMPALEIPASINSSFNNNTSSDGSQNFNEKSINIGFPDVSSDNSDDSLPVLPSMNASDDVVPDENSRSGKTQSKFGKSKGKGRKLKLEKMDEVEKFEWTQPIADQDILIRSSYQAQPVGKGKGKNKKGSKSSKSNYSSFDESSSFDWTRPVREQEVLVHDNARYNPDIEAVLNKTESHIQEQQQNALPNTLFSEHQDIETSLPQIDVPQDHDEIQSLVAEPPSEIHSSAPEIMHDKLFAKISNNHSKIRRTLDSRLKKKKFGESKKDVIELLKMYDNSVESLIENRELSLTSKKSKLDLMSKTLGKKEREMKKLHEYLKSLDKKIKDKESSLNKIIADSVNSQLTKRLVKEKSELKKAINDTMSLNKTLKKKLDTIEKDRIAFDKKREELMSKEQKKFNDMQQTYDKKLKELDNDRKAFEERRAAAIPLLNQADAINKEITEIRTLKDYVEKSKDQLKRKIHEDILLKKSISAAEKTLQHERKDLDKKLFTKYIDETLRGVRPGGSASMPDISEPTHPIFAHIKECKSLIDSGMMSEAKRKYNSIKIFFERTKLDKASKGMAYNAIRELYSDIQLKTMESDLS